MEDLQAYDSEIIQDLLNCADLTKDILDNALDISKLDEGKLNFDMKMEKICQSVEQIISIHRPKAKEKQIALNLEQSTFIPPLIKFDKTRLSQVFYNIYIYI